MGTALSQTRSLVLAGKWGCPELGQVLRLWSEKDRGPVQDSGLGGGGKQQETSGGSMSTKGLLSWGTDPCGLGSRPLVLCLPPGGHHGAEWICLTLRPRAVGTGGAGATGWEGRLAGWVSGPGLGLARTGTEPGTESRPQEPVRH